jgi:hypothetical protein
MCYANCEARRARIRSKDGITANTYRGLKTAPYKAIDDERIPRALEARGIEFTNSERPRVTEIWQGSQAKNDEALQERQAGKLPIIMKDEDDTLLPHS